MAGINNKQELLDKLAFEMFQGFSSDGTPMIFSIFDDMDKARGQQINQQIANNLSAFLRSSQEYFQITIIEYIKIVAEGIELNTAEEVSQFLWHAGYMFGILETNVDNENRKRGGDV